MPNRGLTDPSDTFAALRAAIDRTGYYPEVVTGGVRDAVAGERVVSFYVHHEPTIERDEVRRHITVVVLTASRLILAHTDEHAGDDLLPQPYTSTSTEAISLSSVRSVVVTRMVANPTSGPQPAAEAVLTVGWGGVGRIDLEPAACADPQCEADHGYTGMLASDDFSLRVSAAAEGHDAVSSLLEFAASLSSATHSNSAS
ncbi:phosphodiesterase [Nocardioides sp. Soil797]|nr:phosphodiesterase [Nocardioides sp. Soil797]